MLIRPTYLRSITLSEILESRPSPEEYEKRPPPKKCSKGWPLATDYHQNGHNYEVIDKAVRAVLPLSHEPTKIVSKATHLKRLAIFVSTLFFVFTAAQAETTEIWMGPMGAATDQYTFTNNLSKQAPETLKVVKTIEMYLQPLVKHYSQLQLTALAKVMRDNKIEFAVMTQAIDPNSCTNEGAFEKLGEQSAQDDFDKIKVWFAAGGSMSVLALDGPEKQILYRSPCEQFHPTLGMAAKVIANYMATMRSLIELTGHPVPKFHLVVNFPNWNYGGIRKTYDNLDYNIDYRDVLSSILRAANVDGVKIEGLEIDNPSPSQMGTRMHLLFRQARRLGLKVGMIFNTYKDTRAVGPAACSPANGCDSQRRDYMPPDDVRDLTFMVETLYSIRKWYSDVGEWPDYSIIETWMMHPRAILPETTVGTLTYDLLAAKTVIDGSAPPILIGSRAPLGCWTRDGSRFYGWAFDPDDPATSIYIHIYGIANPTSNPATAAFITSIAADQDCPEADKACQAGGRRHAFSWRVPSPWLGKEPNFYIYALDASAARLSAPGSLVLLTPSGCP